jgi:dihydropteroate synthase
MGILNVTPDSFADGGKYDNFENAIKRANQMISEEVDIIDVGGESTRPGSSPVSLETELDRTVPLITELASMGAMVSIDTTKFEVAQAAIAAGAKYVNDVSGGLADPRIRKLIAVNPEIQIVISHWRGPSKDMQSKANYEDLISEVKSELEKSIDNFLKAGVNLDQIIIDPGLGFAKNSEHNWEILRNIERFELLGFPILIGASRKRFLGDLVGAIQPDDREAATIALTALLAQRGVWGVRVHSVKPHRDAIAVAQELF